MPGGTNIGVLVVYENSHDSFWVFVFLFVSLFDWLVGLFLRWLSQYKAS